MNQINNQVEMDFATIDSSTEFEKPCNKPPLTQRNIMILLMVNSLINSVIIRHKLNTGINTIILVLLGVMNINKIIDRVLLDNVIFDNSNGIILSLLVKT